MLNKASVDVRRVTKNDFQATHAIIVSYIQVPTATDESESHTFQLVLVTDGVDTYSIFVYKQLDTGGATGGSNKGLCYGKWILPRRYSFELTTYSNVGIGGKTILKVTSSLCVGEKAVPYPYGSKHGDFLVHMSPTPYAEEFVLTKEMLLFSSKARVLYIGNFGSIIVDSGHAGNLNVPHYFTYVDVYRIHSENGTIFCREVIHQKELELISKDVRLLMKYTFTASGAIIVSYIEMREYGTSKQKSFQLAVVTNGAVTFAVYKFIRLDSSGGLIGFNEPYCNSSSIVEPQHSRNLLLNTNTNIPGQYIVKLTSQCRIAELYPFGKTTTDTEMTSGHDHTEHFVLDKAMLMFSRLSKDLYIGTSGLISIDEPVNDVLSELLGHQTVVAAYSIDMDTSVTGKIFYRETLEKNVLEAATNDVTLSSTNNFVAKQAVVVTYVDVPMKNSLLLKHTFQIIFTSDGMTTYLILNYIHIDTEVGFSGFAEKFCRVHEISLSKGAKTVAGDTNVNIKGKFVFLLTEEGCKENKGLYPYGSDSGDEEMHRRDNHADGFALSRPMPLFSRMAEKMWISTNGVVAINAYINDRKVKIPNKDTILASYNVDLDLTKGGMIYLRESFDREILEKASQDIKLLPGNPSVSVSHCVLITHVNVPEHGNLSQRHTFQVILASDGRRTYVILIYKKLGTDGATVGVSERFCGWQLLHPAENSTSLVTKTNVGQPGKHVYLLTPQNCQTTELYPHGIMHGDFEMMKGNNYAEHLTLTKPMPLFFQNATKIYISSNGLISFDRSITCNISLPYHETVLSPYHMDFDARNGGSIYYREISADIILPSVDEDVRRIGVTGFSATHVIVITYKDVAHHDISTQKHSFQVVIATNGTHTYAIINYIRLDRTNAVTGISGQRCFWMSFNKYTDESATLSYYLEDRSNVGIRGKFVIPLTFEICFQEININGRWSSDAPYGLTVSRLTYEYIEVKWNHFDNSSDTDLMKFPFDFITIISSDENWIASRYALRSGFNRIGILEQQKMYRIELYTKRRDASFMPGNTSVLENITAVTLEPVRNISVRQISLTEAIAHWTIPEDLLRDTVIAKLMIVHKYTEQGEMQKKMHMVSKCEEQHEFNGTTGSIHTIEVIPIIDAVKGPVANVTHTFYKEVLDEGNSQSNTLLIGIVTTAAILIGIIIYGILWNKQRHKRTFASYLMPTGDKKLDPNKSILEQCNNLRYDQKFEFPRNKLTLVRTIGEGAFGQVWMATSDKMETFKPRAVKKSRSFFGYLFRRNGKKSVVAVKCLKGNATENEYKDLANEIKLLIHLGEHPNIVNLLGACTRGNNLLAVLEYCANGSLLDYLKLKRNQFEPIWVRQDDVGLTLHDLTWIGVQVANGMSFLERKKCVHRDLAARNVLLTEHMNVKVSDFGLARDTDNKSFYLKESEGLLPIKWMAPEAITDRMYTSKSDCWSFGIVMWETYVLGSIPHSSLRNNNIIDYLKTGRRMEKPKHCPNEVYELMLQCWSMFPDMRPSFMELRNKLDQILLNNETSILGGVSMARMLNFDTKSSQVDRETNGAVSLKEDIQERSIPNEVLSNADESNVMENSDMETTELYLFLTDYDWKE